MYFEWYLLCYREAARPCYGERRTCNEYGLSKSSKTVQSPLILNFEKGNKILFRYLINSYLFITPFLEEVFVKQERRICQ